LTESALLAHNENLRRFVNLKIGRGLMRICLYTQTALPKLGGQEAVVDALAREFLALGHEPYVLAPRFRRRLRLVEKPLPYPVIRHPRLVSTKHFVGWYRRFLLQTFKLRPFDILHCHDTYPSGYLAALNHSQIRTPVVITSHGGDIRPENARLIKPGIPQRFKLAIDHADALVSIGRFTTDAFLKLGADHKKIVDIPNGVNLAAFSETVDRPSELPEQVIPNRYALFIGRLAHRKGIDALVNAFAQCVKENAIADDFRLVIAGEGDERSTIEKIIQSNKLQNRVLLVGAAAGKTKRYLLQNARFVAMPSRGWEAFPLVVLEAYAAGKPVVGSRIAGLEDLIQPDRTGLLVESENIGELSAALTRLCNDDAFIQQLGEESRQVAQRYSWRRIAEEHLSLYEKLLAKKTATTN